MKLSAWMSQCFPDFSGGGEGAEFNLQVYANALAKWPPAALAFVKSKIESSRAPYKPSVPVLIGWAVEATRPAENEIRDIERVLNARIVRISHSALERPVLRTVWADLRKKMQLAPPKLSRGETVSRQMLERIAGAAPRGVDMNN